MRKTRAGVQGQEQTRSSYRIARWLAWTAGLLFALVIVLYLAALADEHLEARRDQRIYTQLLTVRLGDTVAEFNRKGLGCKVSQNDGEYSCVIQPITNRLLQRFDWYLMHAYQDAYLWQIIHRQNTGVRNWHLQWWVVVREGRVDEVRTNFFVVGRDMMLGCAWGLAPRLRRVSKNADPKTLANTNTALGITHITAAWSGWGYWMEFTPGSEENELRIREVNSDCLTSFRGCRDSHEFLPNLPSSGDPRFR